MVGHDPRQLRNAFGCFPTGVTVITTVGSNGRPAGLTANSFNSVSMDPPLVLFSLARTAESFTAFRTTRYFAVNVLAAGQADLSGLFASTGTDKFAQISFTSDAHGCARFDGCVAHFECAVTSVYEGGDHLIFVGEVINFDYDSRLTPLLFVAGRYSEPLPPATSMPQAGRG
jgi:3-hydroxy-9,10-secoandrosta-1,3,5(10)-triene-9,17-dione monooxygenase reductase component